MTFYLRYFYRYFYIRKYNHCIYFSNIVECPDNYTLHNIIVAISKINNTPEIPKNDPSYYYGYNIKYAIIKYTIIRITIIVIINNQITDTLYSFL